MYFVLQVQTLEHSFIIPVMQVSMCFWCTGRSCFFFS